VSTGLQCMLNSSSVKINDAFKLHYKLIARQGIGGTAGLHGSAKRLMFGKSVLTRT
jgi:hypothetical protein